MKSTRIYFSTLLALIFSLQGFSQIKKADKLFETYNFSEAIPVYQQVVDENGEGKREATIKLAECYRHINDVTQTRKWYDKVIEMGNPKPISYYYLGQALKGLELYDEAAEAFKKFSTLVPDSLDGEKQAQYCIDIKSWLELPETAEVKNLESLNTRYSEFCPVDYKNGIIFTSDRQKDPLDNRIFGWTNSQYLDLYFAERAYTGKYWSWIDEPAKLMAKNFNQPFHDGPVAFSSDFKQVYITKSASGSAKNEDNTIQTYLLEIFYAQVDGDKKLRYEPFFLNNKNYSVAHPTLSDNNQLIVFSSDMFGGSGGSDLYYCKWDNGKWGFPVNLGKKINTIGNEVFPYFANDSVLFFSSNGLMGYGGLDIFKTTLKAGIWSEPENLKKPFNSSYDDFGVVFSEDMKEGLLSSNRPEGKGSDDIYAFRIRDLKIEKKDLITEKRKDEEKKKEIITPESGILGSGYLKDRSSGKPIDKATLFVYSPISGDVQVLKSDEKGYFEVVLDRGLNYVVKAMKNGFIHDCIGFKSPEDNKTKNFDIPADMLLSKLETGQVFTVKNIYYDVDKWYIREDAQRPLDSLVQIMKQYPIVAELSSHTDSRAAKDYNFELSQKRAEAAVRYIILQGIHPARITAKGYGETRLVNQCADGVDCNENQHQENRRTEFKITAIDGLFFGNYSFDPDLFNEGDVIKANVLGYGFFNDCLNEKQNVKNQPMPEKSNLKTETTGVKANVEKQKAVPELAEEPVKNEVSEKPNIQGVNYRIQLIALSKALKSESYFLNIEDLVKKYEITVLEADMLYKYQLGNFSTRLETENVVKELKNRGYHDCFIVQVTD